MKITKEKVIYFLSLNIFFYTFYLLIIHFFISDKEIPSIINSFKISVFSIPLAVGVSLFALYYRKNHKNYSLIELSYIIAIVSGIYTFIIFFFIPINFSSIEKFLSSFDSIFLNILIIAFVLCLILVLIVYVYSLIILKITDPLRKKIKW